MPKPVAEFKERELRQVIVHEQQRALAAKRLGSKVKHARRAIKLRNYGASRFGGDAWPMPFDPEEVEGLAGVLTRPRSSAGR